MVLVERLVEVQNSGIYQPEDRIGKDRLAQGGGLEPASAPHFL
jgi:hypothetical protein